MNLNTLEHWNAAVERKSSMKSIQEQLDNLRKECPMNDRKQQFYAEVVGVPGVIGARWDGDMLRVYCYDLIPYAANCLSWLNSIHEFHIQLCLPPLSL